MDKSLYERCWACPQAAKQQCKGCGLWVCQDDSVSKSDNYGVFTMCNPCDWVSNGVAHTRGMEAYTPELLLLRTARNRAGTALLELTEAVRKSATARAMWEQANAELVAAEFDEKQARIEWDQAQIALRAAQQANLLH